MQRVLQVPCNGRPSLLSRLAKKAIGRKHTTFTSCKHAACSNELFSLSSRLCFGGKRFDWANVNFGRLLNIFHTERSWHAYWFSLVGMISLMQEHFLSWPLYKCKAPRNQSPSVSNSQRWRSCEQIFDSSTTFLNPLVGTNSLIIWKTDSRFFFARLWGSRASRA